MIHGSAVTDRTLVTGVAVLRTVAYMLAYPTNVINYSADWNMLHPSPAECPAERDNRRYPVCPECIRLGVRQFGDIRVPHEVLWIRIVVHRPKRRLRVVRAERVRVELVYEAGP